MSVNDNDFMEWEVKPIFEVYYPSEMTGVDPNTQASFTVFGLERQSGEIVRNYEKIHSVEQHNQGYKKMPGDYTLTLAVKEQGDSFEKLRRLGKSGTLFDVHLNLVQNIESGDHRASEHEYAQYEWMQGFEKWIGCIIQRESQTIEIGDIPIREFECDALRHAIKGAPDTSDYATTESEEGDGVPPTMADLMG